MLLPVDGRGGDFNYGSGDDGVGLNEVVGLLLVAVSMVVVLAVAVLMVVVGLAVAEF